MGGAVSSGTSSVQSCHADQLRSDQQIIEYECSSRTVHAVMHSCHAYNRLLADNNQHAMLPCKLLAWQQHNQKVWMTKFH